MVYTIEDTILRSQSGDYMYLEKDTYILVVTHGDSAGNLQTPKGRLISPVEFAHHMVRLFGDKEVNVLACNEQARSNKGLPDTVDVTPLGHSGDIKVKYHHYIDGLLGDLLVEVTDNESSQNSTKEAVS